jgi:ketosteroid isomerase-like protein
MRKTRSLAAIAAALVLISFVLPAPVQAADAKAALIEREHQCLAQTTLDAAMECYDPSDALVLYDANTPREFDGAKAVRTNFQPAYDDMKNPKYDISAEHAEVAAKLGYTFGIVHLTGTDKAGKPVDLTWRSTNIWRNEHGVWKMIHEHNSFPVDMATGKVDMQSK